MDRDLYQQIWPIFSAESREHLSSIGSGVLDLERDPKRADVLESVKRTAHSLKGAAASLGLADVETLAHAIEGSLAGFDPAKGLSGAAVQAALDAVEAIEQALAAGDAGRDVTISTLPRLVAGLGALPGADMPASARAAVERAGRPAAQEAARPASGARSDLDALEAALRHLCAPMDPARRESLAREGAEAARRLAGTASGAAEKLARRIAEAFPATAAAGEKGARAAAALAGDLVQLRNAFERRDGQETRPPGDGHADKSIRVLASTLESVARQLELLGFSEARHSRRAREVLAAENAVREAIRGVEQTAHALRVAGGEGAEEMRASVQQLRGIASELARIGREASRDSEQQRLAVTVLREDLRGMRMVPAALALEPLRRAVRDAAGRLGKPVRLTLEGGAVKLDRRVIDLMRDPLLHLVRNAVDHGIEAPEERRAAGKPEEGNVVVKVEPRGTRVGIVVSDDGAGLDLAAIRAAAVRKGVATSEAAAQLTDAQAARLVFHAGLSTAKAVTAFSGRGVGLDVVQEALARLQGSVDVSHEPGRGTRFELDVPLTLAATPALLFRVGREIAALSADAVERVVLLGDGDMGTVAGRTTVPVGEEQIPYASLPALIGVSPGTGGKRRPALVLASGAQRVAVGVDEVLGQQELVVSSLGTRVGRVAHLAGAALLDDGRIVGVLAAPEIFRRAQPAEAAPAPAGAKRARILVVDDSLTTRAAVKGLLEIAGYAVLPAADGEEAWTLLRESGADLVVTDIQMPRLDGFGLTRRIKADPRLRSLPVVLVTSLEAPEDRAAGLDSGADGYLVKRDVERGKLLDVVRQLLPGHA